MPHGGAGVTISHNSCGIGWGSTERDIAIVPLHPERPASRINDTLLSPSVHRMYIDDLHEPHDLGDIRANLVSYITTKQKLQTHNPFSLTTSVFSNPLGMFAMTVTRKLVTRALDSTPTLEAQNPKLYKSLSSFTLKEDLIIFPKEWLKVLTWLETAVQEEDKPIVQAALNVVATYGRDNKKCMIVVPEKDKVTTTIVDDEFYLSVQLPTKTLTIVLPHWDEAFASMQHGAVLHGKIPIGATSRTTERVTEQIVIRGDRTSLCNLFFCVSPKKKKGERKKEEVKA